MQWLHQVEVIKLAFQKVHVVMGFVVVFRKGNNSINPIKSY